MAKRITGGPVGRAASAAGEGAARQRAQADLLDRAMRSPGVAEQVEVYGRYAPYVPQLAGGRMRVRNATGGNE